MNTNFVRGDSFLFKFSIKNKQGDNITAEDIDTAELRNWIKPTETMEESEKKVIEIESREPSIEQIIGNEVE